MNQANENETKVGHASFGIGAVIIDPFGEIRRAGERKDWFAGLSASATYFEYWGTIKLKAYFKFHGIGLEKTGEVKKMFGEFIDRLGVRKMIELLYWFGIIDEPMYNQMKEVNRERNKLIHPQTEGIAYRFQDEEHFRNLLDQASHCIETLQSIRFEKNGHVPTRSTPPTLGACPTNAPRPGSWYCQVLVRCLRFRLLSTFVG